MIAPSFPTHTKISSRRMEVQAKDIIEIGVMLNAVVRNMRELKRDLLAGTGSNASCRVLFCVVLSVLLGRMTQSSCLVGGGQADARLGGKDPPPFFSDPPAGGGRS